MTGYYALGKISKTSIVNFYENDVNIFEQF